MGGAAPPVEDGYAKGHNAFAGGHGAHFALRQMNPLREWAEQLTVFFLLGLVLGWIGPFGTFQDLGVGPRFAYWMTAILLIGAASAWTQQAIARGQPSAAWPLLLQVIVGALIVSVPGTFVIIAVETVFRHTPPITIATLARMYLSVTVVMLAISGPWSIIRRYQARLMPPISSGPLVAPAPEAEVERVAAPRRESPFLERIPLKLGRELLLIATEDHYLRVTTPLGHDLILYRLSDAIAELDPALGQQVHRSYWVARKAIASVERDGQRTTLVLTNGTKVPVSRTYVPALREAGWLKG